MLEGDDRRNEPQRVRRAVMAVPPTAGYGLLKRPSPGCEGTDETRRVEMWRGGGRSNISVAAPFRLAVPEDGRFVIDSRQFHNIEPIQSP